MSCLLSALFETQAAWLYLYTAYSPHLMLVRGMRESNPRAGRCLMQDLTPGLTGYAPEKKGDHSLPIQVSPSKEGFHYPYAGIPGQSLVRPEFSFGCGPKNRT